LERIRPFSFARVFTSPLQRALETWKLTGSGVVADVDRDLLEWE
jgi:probable phosphoglycerate mutase